MRTLSERRKRTTEFVVKCLEILEGGKINSTQFLQTVTPMSDKQFEEFMQDVRKNQEIRQIAYFEIEEFKRDVDLDKCKKCLDIMGVPLYEYVAVPDVTGDPDNVQVTPEPVPVGYAHYKRMPQTTHKKNSLSLNVDKKNPLTGQVVSQDKTAKNTDIETYAMSSIGAKIGLRELNGPRGSDPVMEAEMMQAVSNTGSVTMAQLTSDPKNKVALNTLNAYFTMQMFCTNLLGPIGILPRPEER